MRCTLVARDWVVEAVGSIPTPADTRGISFPLFLYLFVSWNVFYILQYNFKTNIIMRTTKNNLRMRELGFKNGLEVWANGNNIHSDSDICEVLFSNFPDVANKITEYLDEISE